MIPRVLVCFLLVTSAMPVDASVSGRNSGVDLSITAFEIQYDDSLDENKYRIFSSASIPTRSDNLYAIDGVLFVASTLTLRINNAGTNTATGVSATVAIIHDEYGDFEIYNETKSVSSINGQSSIDFSFQITPDYAGNHTMVVTLSSLQVDDNPADNRFQRHFTVAAFYEVFDDLTPWTLTTPWQQNSQAALSNPNSLHAGNGQGSTYQPNSFGNALSPVLDLSDGLVNHNRAIGVAFFYSGAVGSGDNMRLLAKDDQGNWNSLLTLSQSIDSTANSWNTQIGTYNGISSPIIPIPTNMLHSSAQFKFEFNSDSSVEDVGYWIDDFLILYDQRARDSEYGVNLVPGSQIPALPGQTVTREIIIENTGNVSDSYALTATGVPPHWESYFTYDNGASITSGVQVEAGESKSVFFKALTDENTSHGVEDIDIWISSLVATSIEDYVSTSVSILPTVLPQFASMPSDPKCSAGQSSNFAVHLKNIGQGDGAFLLSFDKTFMPLGWDIELGWNQSATMNIPSGSTTEVWLSTSLPNNAQPGEKGEFTLVATAQQDETKSDQIDIEIISAMVSDAIITLDEEQEGDIEVEPGSSYDLAFNVQNMASRMDVFQPSLEYTGQTGWGINLVNPSSLAINAQSSTIVKVRVEVPENSQAGDRMPAFKLVMTSQESDVEFQSELFSNITASAWYDLQVDFSEPESVIYPNVPFEISFFIENMGNGPVDVITSIDGIKDSWDSWLLFDGGNFSQEFELTARYESPHSGEVTMVILAPKGAGPGLLHELTINVEPKNGVDMTPNGNEYYFTVRTAAMRIPTLLVDGEESANLAVNVDHTIYGNLSNLGNTPDSGATILVQIDNIPVGVSANLILDGGNTLPVNQWHEITLNPEATIPIKLVIETDNQSEINSILNVQFRYRSGDASVDEITTTRTMIITEKRMVEVQVDSWTQFQSVSTNNFQFKMSLASSSTQPEKLHFYSDMPEGWGLICSGVPLHLENLTVEFNAGHIQLQEKSIECTMLRESGTESGVVSIFVQSEDGFINMTYQESMIWMVTIEDSVSFFENPSATIGLSSLVLICVVLLFFVMRTRSHDDEEDTLDVESIENQSHASNQSQFQQSGTKQTLQQNQTHSHYQTAQQSVQMQTGPPAYGNQSLHQPSHYPTHQPQTYQQPVNTFQQAHMQENMHVNQQPTYANNTPYQPQPQQQIDLTYEQQMEEYQRKMAEWQAKYGG